MDMRRVEERWGSAEFTQSLEAISWMASPAVLLHLNERATGDPARDWLSAWAQRFFVGDGLRVLVLGCGQGWLERALAKQPFIATIDAVDVASPAVDRARKSAEAEGLTNIRYRTADLNRDELGRGAYDAVVAHSILHHVAELENVFEQIERAMKPDGTLIVNEYVGPSRFQFGDDILAIINTLLACLPSSLRRSALNGSTCDRKERPTVEEVVAADPSEAIRSDELREQISVRFDILGVRELGGTVLQFLLYDIVQNFRFDEPRERAMIELMCAFEGALVDAGVIPSDFAIYAARKRSSQLPLRCYSRKPPARPAAARDVDADPLGLGSRVARATRRGQRALLPPWAVRMLRIVLTSEREVRRNLIRESSLRTAIEQLRYAAARDAGVFDWIIGRWLARAKTRDERSEAIGQLLEAFEQIALQERLIGR